MKKVALNSPCPCGSGKKYKRCHGREVNKNERNDMKMNFENLIKKYSPLQTIKLLGALQLNAANHGKSILFEEMARLALLEQRNNQGQVKNAYWQQLKSAIEGYTERVYLVDEPTSAFTENIVFAEGNYIVYPGISVSASTILNGLLECIFLVKNTLSEEYKKFVNDGVGLLLFMTNSVANDLNHTRNMFERNDATTIRFSEYEKAMEAVNAITFSKEYLKEISVERHYDAEIISEFLIDINDRLLDNDDPDYNLSHSKPILQEGDEFVLYMPTTLMTALIEFIYRKAKEYSCYESLIALFQKRQFEKTCSAITKMGWIERTIELPKDNFELPVQEAVFQFDDQKVGYLCFIGKRLGKSEKSAPSSSSIASFRERNDEVVNYLSKLTDEQPCQVLTVFVLSEIGEDFYFLWPKSPGNHLSLSLTYSELEAIAYSDNANILTLWKFAKTFRRTSDLLRIEAPGGTLDAYVAYETNSCTFLNPNEANPIGGTLYVPVGFSNDFLREIKMQRDEHAAKIFYEGKIGYTKVLKYKDYAPIYIEKESIVQQKDDFRLVIEIYEMPIWIISKSKTPRKNNHLKYLCEGIAFWLYKMESYLRPILAILTFVQFDIDAVVEEHVESDLGFKKMDVHHEENIFKITINAPTIQISIPPQFLALVTRPDNVADKLLMKSVLHGLVKYVEEEKGQIVMSEAAISAIIEDVLKPANAKMFLFPNPSSNIRLDDRSLTSLLYIHEADTSFLLDNLISFLPKGTAVPKFINEKKEKVKFCNLIVAGLITRIAAKIEEFEGSELLQRLIKINEKCIQVREFNEILIPARIACFSTLESEVFKLLEKNENRISTHQALRTLIEFVAAKPPARSKWPNYDEIGELLALVDQLISWGSESDSIYFDLEDPKIGLLPSGRIGTEKSFQKDVLEPFAQSRATVDVSEYIEGWEKNYNRTSAKEDSPKDFNQDELDNAFQFEFGITLTKLTQITWVLIAKGFNEGNPCVTISEDSIYTLIQGQLNEVTKDEITIYLNLHTLLKRENLGMKQQGFNWEEIYPWRHKRLLSYLRRPLVSVEEDGRTVYYFGYRHLVDFIDNLYYLLYNGKFPTPKTKPLNSWLGSISSGKGNPFRQEVQEWFEKATKFQVIPHELDIDIRGHLKADRNYGDIDLLVINHEKEIIYSIECKNISGAKTVYEMWSEVSSYLGNGTDDEGAKIVKHLRRHDWLQKNKTALKQIHPNLLNYDIKSFVLTAQEIPLTYLKKHSLPLPILAFTILKLKGIEALNNL
jgi:hypothetical protein